MEGLPQSLDSVYLDCGLAGLASLAGLAIHEQASQVEGQSAEQKGQL